MGQLRGEEEWARQLIARQLGVPVEQHDDGSRPGMHDLDIVHDDRRAAVEVTGAVDQAATELWRVAYRDGRWVEPSLVGGWSVHVDPSAPRRQGQTLRRDLPVLLGLFERAGAVAFPTAETVARFEPLAQALGVVSANQGGTDYPGSIYVTPEVPAERRAGFAQGTGDALAEWVGVFLRADARADVLAKLARSGFDERHVFIVVGTEPGLAFSVVDHLIRNDAPTPTVAPDLPVEVTDAWVASVWDAGRGFRWSPGGGWQTFDKTTPTEETEE